MNFRYWKNRISVLLLSATVSLSACSESEEPFDGADNYVVSFVLTKEGTSFSAAVSGNEIVLSAPENISLNNATAEVGLSENATIYPDPAKIKDWDNDQMFVVTSYGGTDRTYKYTVSRTGKACMESISLNSQADVDAFAAYGYTAIYGSLNIGEAVNEDVIESLEGLRGLREISANLTIGAAYGGKSLDGLDNLQTVGSFIVASATDSLVDMALPGLEEIRANAVIAGKNVYTVSFPRLKKIGGSLTAQVPVKSFDFSALQEVGCDLRYHVTGESVMESLVFQSLRNVGGIFSLEMVLNVKNGALTTLDLPSLARCGSLSIGTISTLSTLYVPKLEQVDGSFNTGANSYIEAAFPSLKKVGTWTVHMQSSELDLRGIAIDNLIITRGVITGKNPQTIIGDEAFGGNIEIEGAMMTATSPLTLKGFTTIGSLTLGNFMKTFEFSLPDTKVVTGTVDIESGNRFTLSSFPFPLLEEVGGDLLTGTWRSWDSESFDMTYLRRVGGNFTLGFSGSKVTALKLPALEEVGGDFEILTATSIGNIEVKTLKTVSGLLSILPTSSGSTVNSALENLNGFSDLETVGGITVMRHGNLRSFAGLKNTLPSLSESNWTVDQNGYNPTYEDLKAGKWEQQENN